MPSEEASAPLRKETLLHQRDKFGFADPLASLRDLVSFHENAGRYDEAEALLTDDVLSAVVEAGEKAEVANLLRIRGGLRARQGHWPSSTIDYLELRKLQPDDRWALCRLLALLAYAGDATAYHKQCQQALVQYAQTSDPSLAEQTVKFCLILPWPDGDFQATSDLADVAMDVESSHEGLPFFQFSKGLAEFRQGRFDSASRRYFTANISPEKNTAPLQTRR